mmetsp:Transcript_6747/g.13240  ORF Transcript_6747/g.13240 Transcript_6747/m.13240 type:complete len:86 (+) Transcript_6747:315-572(+)
MLSSGAQCEGGVLRWTLQPARPLNWAAAQFADGGWLLQWTSLKTKTPKLVVAHPLPANVPILFPAGLRQVGVLYAQGSSSSGCYL